jgi:cytochrome c nitrite reductase small subunit
VTAGAVAAALMGIAIGIAGFTFGYARGASYLSNDPQACANCHVMQQQFDGWLRASHRTAATCT